MTAFITLFVNASENRIILADDMTNESFSIPAGGDDNPRWQVRARPQAIRRAGQAGADWIWRDGAHNIMILRAGRRSPEVLARLRGAGVCGLQLNCDDLGELSAVQSANAQASAAELAF
ncbi:MAG TPA: hypothetical protein VEH76_13175 [Methylocystis sp.]|nr:hypothetical protein [Methylocystis sp.]